MAGYRNIVVLTGAGISQESGLKTFRGSDGLWEGHRVEDVATPEAFRKNPELVHRFYNQRRRQLFDGSIHPNPAHLALAEFEQRFRGNFLLVTQNVDNLHERAGSRNVLHMHGQLAQVRCARTGEVFEWDRDLAVDTHHPRRPELKGTLRPNVVWFGEVPFGLEAIERAVTRCDLFVAIGTSGVVYPAAGLVALTPPSCRRVEINLQASEVADAFDTHLTGPASQTVPAFLATL